MAIWGTAALVYGIVIIFFKVLTKISPILMGKVHRARQKLKKKKSSTIILHLREGGEEAVRENFFKAQQNF